MSARKFEPWKRDRSRGLKTLLWSVVAGAGAVFFAMNGNAPFAIGLLLLAVVMTKIGAAELRSAENREFGKTFEAEFVQRALREMEKHDIPARANVMARGVGDIDLVAGAGGQATPIEIKSFRRWHQFLVFRGARERKALLQAERQRRALGAKAGLVWLPQGRPTLLQRIFGVGDGQIVVVFGSERALVRVIKQR